MFCVASTVVPAAIVTFPASVPPLSVNAKDGTARAGDRAAVDRPACSPRPPMPGASASVAPVLFSVPSGSPAAVAVKSPRPAKVKTPPRLTVAPLAVMTPLFTQFRPPRVGSVWPLGMVMTPVVDERVVGVVAGDDAAAARDGDAAADGQRHRIAAVVPLGDSSLLVLLPNVTVPLPASVWLPLSKYSTAHRWRRRPDPGRPSR